MKSNVSRITSLLLVSVAFSSLISMFALTRIDNIVHQDLYRYNLRFSYEWAMPYWTMTALVFAMGWVNIFTAIIFQFYVLLYAQIEPSTSPVEAEPKQNTKLNWRVSWRNIFDILIKLDTRKLQFGIGNPYGKSIIVEADPRKRQFSMTLYPYEKEFMLR